MLARRWSLVGEMTGGRCHRRKKVLDSSISRVPTENSEEKSEITAIGESTPLNIDIDLYTQARKALSERTPFDTEDVQEPNAHNLPRELANSLSKQADGGRKRHRKSHLGVEKKSSEKSRGSGIWVETEEYFRGLSVDDVEKLYEVSSFRFLDSGNCLLIPYLEKNKMCTGDINGNASDFSKGLVVKAEVKEEMKEEAEENEKQLMEVDSAVGGTELPTEEKGCSLSQKASGLEWLLGSRSKLYLTSERPSKKRKLFGKDAGLEKLFIASPVEGSSSLCHYCSLGDTGDQLNRLIVCSSCNVAVHQRCYGAQEDPSGPWLCSWCKKMNHTKSSEKPCMLCPKQGGALKLVQKRGYGSDNGGSMEFAHLFCCQWMPEVYTDDTRTMEPIMNVEGIKETRWKLICRLCKTRSGACLRCSNGACRASFHPICAREARQRMEIWGKFGCDDVELRAFCLKHSEVQNNIIPEQAGDQFVRVGSCSNITKPQAASSTVIIPHEPKAGIRNGDKTADMDLDGPDQSECDGAQPLVNTDILDKGGGEDINTADSYIGTLPRNNMRVKLNKSTNMVKVETGVADDTEVAVSDSRIADDVPVTSVPPRKRTKGNIRILKDDNKDVCLSSAISKNDGVAMEDQGGHIVRDEALLSTVFEGGRVEEEATISEKNVAVDSNLANPICAVSMNHIPDFIKVEACSSSYIHPSIQRTLSEIPSCVVPKRTTSEYDGSRDREFSALEASSCSSVCSNQHSQNLISVELTSRFGVNLEQLSKARSMDILEQSPVDEVEGELIFFQQCLLRNAVARKQSSDDLIYKVLKSLPNETDGIRKQSWDAVLVSKYLCELKEVKKQGRKERRDKEAQVVLAAATAAAAASSRISSFRKDSPDESAFQNPLKVNNPLSGRGGLYSQQMPPRAKDMHSRLAIPIPRVSLEKSSDAAVQSASDFSKAHPRNCEICRRSESILNPILVCSSCKVAVHLDCYRRDKDVNGPWYCELCDDLSSSRRSGAAAVNAWEKPYCVVECGLCGGTAGAFRKSTDGQWIHAFCAEWVLESTFKRGQENSIQGMETVSKGIEMCQICRRKQGVCIKCNYGHCQSFFHPSCARSAGFYMNLKTSGPKVQHKAYCEKHSRIERAKAETQKHGGIEELSRLKPVRVELEKLRLLCERIIKREKLKRELVVCSHEILASNRDAVAFACSSFFPRDVSSESATTSLKGDYTDGSEAAAAAIQRSDDITVDSTVAGKKRRIKFPTVSIDNNEQKTDGSSTSSQQIFTSKPLERALFSGKQIPQRPPVASRSSSGDDEKRLKNKKHTEIVGKEVLMTSDQASMRNQRLPKGFAYVQKETLKPLPDACPQEQQLKRDG